MSNKVRTISVVDGNGDQVILYEIRERGSLFGLLPRKRLQLGTGEVVVRRGGGYVIPSTGEKLTRVPPAR